MGLAGIAIASSELAVSLGKNIKRLRTVAVSRSRRRWPNCSASRRPSLSDWEHDRYAILEVSSLIKLAKVLHCSVDELLTGVDPDYDRLREGGAVGAVPARPRPDIPVIAEGDALPDGITWDEREQERPAVLGWLSRPGDLGDPNAYGIRIRGDARSRVLAKHRSGTTARADVDVGFNGYGEDSLTPLITHCGGRRE